MSGSAAVKCVVGLGNPGPKYAATRHNIGFMVVDELARRHMMTWQSKFKAELGRARLGDDDCWLFKPLSFMNVSGDPVSRFCSFYKIDVTSLLVLHDELALPLGEFRLKDGGGHNGHNGLRDIVARTGERGFKRIRIGVGRPAKGSPADHVLSPFASSEQVHVSAVVDACADVVSAIAQRGFTAVLRENNGRVVI